jgi:radical SAM superfamily enzyme YgiQ (UPF0313 family)
MPSRVLLISTNRCVIPDPVFPLALAHLSAALRRAGHETRWYDIQLPNPPLQEVLQTFQPALVGISQRNIDDVLVRSRQTYFQETATLCRQVRETSGAQTVLGGSGFGIFPKELLEFSGADFGVCGAGEAPLLAILSALEAGHDCQHVPGLVHRRDGRVVVNPPVSEVPHTALTPADRPAEIVARYLQRGGMLNIQTQRGCAFHCCYCTYPLLEGRAHRRRPPDAVAEEFEQLQNLGARYAFIVDSVFNSSVRHVAEICEAILARNLKLKWGCFLRPQGLTSELMKLMARAGLTHIEFGSDSFCDEVLATYDKGLSFDDIAKSSELAYQEKLDYCHFLIAGGPGETRETLRQGFERSKRLSGTVIMAVVGARIYPGTTLHQRALAEGVIDSGTDLLTPAYYFSPQLTADQIFADLQEHARTAPNWIVGDPTPAFAKLVDRLRDRGVVGPLWSYLSMIQRIWPQRTPPIPAPTAQSFTQ